MRLLCFQAKRFWWKTFEKTLPEAPEQEVEHEVCEAVVAFVHVEAADAEPGREASVFRQALKHLKWLANKRDFRTVVPALLYASRRRKRRAGRRRAIARPSRGTLGRDGLRSTRDALRLPQRVGSQCLWREPRQGLEAGLNAAGDFLRARGAEVPVPGSGRAPFQLECVYAVCATATGLAGRERRCRPLGIA